MQREWRAVSDQVRELIAHSMPPMQCVRDTGYMHNFVMWRTATHSLTATSTTTALTHRQSLPCRWHSLTDTLTTMALTHSHIDNERVACDV
jgi:hypothetical protein